MAWGTVIASKGQFAEATREDWVMGELLEKFTEALREISSKGDPFGNQLYVCRYVSKCNR
jgi:hypothetical protein